MRALAAADQCEPCEGGAQAATPIFADITAEARTFRRRNDRRKAVRSSSRVTLRWRKPDSNLYGAFPVK